MCCTTCPGAHHPSLKLRSTPRQPSRTPSRFTLPPAIPPRRATAAVLPEILERPPPVAFKTTSRSRWSRQNRIYSPSRLPQRSGPLRLAIRSLASSPPSTPERPLNCPSPTNDSTFSLNTGMESQTNDHSPTEPQSDLSSNHGRARAGTFATINTLASVTDHGHRDSNQFRLRKIHTGRPSTQYQVEAAGLEPGIDVEAESTTDERIRSLKAPCQITVVEYNESRLQIAELWNEEIEEFLARGKPDWVKVRWINCNGRWSVVSTMATFETDDVLLQDFRGRLYGHWLSITDFILLVCENVPRFSLCTQRLILNDFSLGGHADQPGQQPTEV